MFRNRRRSLFAMIGIALALSLMTGSFIAVDSSSYGVLRSAIGGVEVDFIAHDYNFQSTGLDPGKIERAITTINDVRYVDQACPLAYVYGLSETNPVNNVSYYGVGGRQLLMLPHDDDWVLDRFDIHGEMPDLGTAAVPASVATALGLEVGDTILCQAKGDEWGYVNGTYSIVGSLYANITFTVSQIWTQDRDEQNQYWYTSLTTNDVLINGQYNPVIINIEDGQGVFDQLTQIERYNSIGSGLYYYIWIDRGEVITLADIEGSLERLKFIQTRLQTQGYAAGFNVEESELSYDLRTLSPELSILKMLFLVLSLPVIALGIYLSIVGIDLGITGRRREVGMLKSRGASNRQVFGSLMTESLILGVIASLIGLGAGILVSRFLLGSALSFSSMSDSTGTGEWEWTDLRISGNTIALSLFFGVVLMLLSTYRPYKRVSKTPVAEALHHYSSISTKTRYRAGVDFILLGLSVLSIASVLTGTEGIHDHGWSWITEIIITVLLLVGIIMFPIMPFFMSVAVVRLLTRGSHKLYAKFTALVRPWTKELTYLVDRNIVRNPRRASNLGVIISLALAFGLFISVTMESSISFEKEQVHFDVGSDIRLSGYSRYGPSEGPGLDYSVLEQIDGLTGVGHVSHFIYLNTVTSYFGGPNTVVLNTSEYLDAVDPSNSYFIGHGHGVMDDLAQNGTCLVSQDYADERAIMEGDILTLTLQLYAHYNITYGYESYILRVEVIGMVKGLPGLSGGDMFVDSGTLRWIPFSNLTTQGTTFGAFIKVSRGADPTEVANRATGVLSAGGINANAEILEDRLVELESDPTYGALSDFLYMEYALAIVIMSVGVGLIIFVAVNDREHELACIMARGSSGSQMRKILMGESMTLMSLGLIVGASVGILTAYLFNTLFGESYSVVQRHMVFTWVSWLVVIASVASLLVASLLATIKAGRMKLAEVLRIRGG